MAIFISYSHQDKEFAEKLATNLMIRKARVWVDSWELKVGDSLVDRVQEALQAAGALLVVLSEASVQSEWCRKELSAGLLRELEERRVVVLPVRLDNCQVPIFLRGKLYADFRANFDEGLTAVLEGIAAVTTETLGTTKTHAYHQDWNLHSGHFGDHFEVRMMGAERGDDPSYTVVTQVVIRGNEAATALHLRYDEAGFGWYPRKALLRTLGKFVENNAVQIVLEDEWPRGTGFELNHPGGLGYRIEIESRRLGGDNGKDIFVDVSDQLANICASHCERLRDLTPEESAQVQRATRSS